MVSIRLSQNINRLYTFRYYPLLFIFNLLVSLEKKENTICISKRGLISVYRITRAERKEYFVMFRIFAITIQVYEALPLNISERQTS
jgi:hypothetical protein